MTTNDIDIKVLEARLLAVRKTVQELEEKAASYNDELAKERRALEITEAFYNLELHRLGVSIFGGAPHLFEMPPRFANVTIRKACFQLLKERGAMHVADLQAALAEGGQNKAKTSITGTLIRGKEFERVPMKPNTFRLRDENQA